MDEKLKIVLLFISIAVCTGCFMYVSWMIIYAFRELGMKRKGWKERMEEDILSTMSMVRHIEKILEKEEKEEH